MGKEGKERQEGAEMEGEWEKKRRVGGKKSEAARHRERDNPLAIKPPSGKQACCLIIE